MASNVQTEIRISELPVAPSVNGDDKLEATQGDVTRSITVGQIATQVGVQLDLSTYARIDSPIFVGNPRAPTPVSSDSDTSVATTGFVQAVVAAIPPATALDINTVILRPIAAPASPTTGWVLFTDSGDGNKLKAKASTGTVVTVGTP